MGKAIKIKPGESLNDRVIETTKLINGYSQMNGVERALGYNHASEIAFDTHLVTWGDIEYSILWLMGNGFEITKSPEQIWFLENSTQEWLTREHTFTKNPIEAKQFSTKYSSYSYMRHNGIYDCNPTEHQFI